MSKNKNTPTTNSPLRLVIVIGSFVVSNSGVGGHYYSAMTIAQELNKVHCVNIVNVGDFPADALNKSPTPVTYINLEFNILGINRNPLKRFLEAYKPDVVIAFDLKSALITRPLCMTLNCGFVLVKAGGDKPSRYYPNNPFQIHFSSEDALWATARQKNSYGKICYIPNRVTYPKQDWQTIAKLKNHLSILQNDLVIIRISRITETYKPSFLAAIRLVNFLRDAGYPARLIIIGICESESVLQDIESQLSHRDAVITSEDFTVNATRLLKIAHINIGVGRGFMEGCALGQHMLAINFENKLPTVVTQDNFNIFLKENFSMRVGFSVDAHENEQKIISIAELCMKGSINSELSQKWFKEKFSSEMVPSLYGEILNLAHHYPEKWTLDVVRCELFLAELGLRRFAKTLIFQNLK